MMGEGNTPLVRSTNIARTLGADALYFKLESCNPSGSYKDRFVASEIRSILDGGGRSCVATSSGNTGSALAAYCARYRLPCIILVNHDAPAGKLMQMRAHGATVLRIRDFVASPDVTQSVFEQISRFTSSGTSALVVSAYRYCPEGMRGVQRISHELCGALEHIDHVFVPVGGGGLTAAVLRGFEDEQRMPRVHAVQPEGCPTLLDAFRNRELDVRPVPSTTRISGLSVPFDIDATLALGLLRKHRGSVTGVSDEEVFAAQKALLRDEGIYAEPAGATALAGYKKALADGIVSQQEHCVCLVTGHGFKDPSSIEVSSQGAASPVLEAGQVLAALEGASGDAPQVWRPAPL